MQSDIAYVIISVSEPNMSKSASNYVYMSLNSASYFSMCILIAKIRMSPCMKKEQAWTYADLAQACTKFTAIFWILFLYLYHKAEQNMVLDLLEARL